MDKEAELLNVIKETSGGHFHLAANSEGNWTLQIFKTKVMFKGSLNEVFQLTINELIESRTLTPPFAKIPKPHRKKYQYQISKTLLKQSQDNKNLANPKTADRNGNYTMKLNFTKSKGFTNVCEGMAALGKTAFETEFKQWLNNRK
ncbi:hypothetical protein GON26_01195 [Flavobacterium sp. GA093]|uniref:Uncharacterized protein n=1 Tax=Flavobacterium hydrocarbonoxydans TaxID=2683249 RepID=A0A6I4NK58_9FLAO|nr:hypothetical protein [Flavobacterium hydrocarbonoxydans]MWB92965.1 hypothetical protein [Flavobacterium hydrocarbonoxydans]